ncbi:hypothetical protein E2C01_021388 [Portunus trituberculatus]|uniref:Uncharacterized protein n=1 Tax=Portunus trituberculatus TaxID=210409 RepID=A0A5B7E4I7_PORTR|nr:hypothetical protein [Portunus trituberculatus]
MKNRSGNAEKKAERLKMRNILSRSAECMHLLSLLEEALRSPRMKGLSKICKLKSTHESNYEISSKIFIEGIGNN